MASLVVSAPAVLNYLGKGRLETRPIDVCIYLLFPIVVLSSFVAGGFEAAWEYGVAFFKIVVYYVLLVSLVTTPRRIRLLLGWLILFTCVVTILAALDFYKVIAIPDHCSIPATPPRSTPIGCTARESSRTRTISAC